MEAVCSLKRHRQPTDFKECIICQEEKADKNFIQCGEQGLAKLKTLAVMRNRLCDAENRLVIDRILELSSSNVTQDLWYHKSCYSTFTSKSHIERLDEKRSSAKPQECEPSSSGTTLRSSTTAVDWDVCMFCQDTSLKETLCSVTTLKMSDTILNLSKFDQDVHVRLSGISDIIAAEGKYHPKCFKKFQYNASKAKTTSETQKTDLAMGWLTADIMDSSKKGHVLQLSEVWNRYVELAGKAGTEISPSFLSRRTTFKQKLQPAVESVYDFVTVPNREVLLVPRKFGHTPFSDLLSADQEESAIPKYQPPDQDFLEMVHVALMLRGEILAHPQHKGFVVNEDEMMQCVPDKLFMFIRFMFGGDSLLGGSLEEQEDTDMDQKETATQTGVLSLAQDLVYNVTGGKHWTPKHVGLASTLHQATRSKELVQLFHNAGHIVSYHSLLQVDTAMAEKTLQTMDADTGAVIPPNCVPSRFTHFSCDNIDIDDAGLDGKESFHATQMAAWQRGPEGDMVMKDMKPSHKESLQVPLIVQEIFPAGVVEGKVPPTATENTKKEWFGASKDNESARQATTTDLAFIIQRQNEEAKEGWTSFNQRQSNVLPEVTSVGYMPLILAPAHELDTLNTVVIRCKYVANRLGQYHVVITADEQLFYKLMELKWAKPEYKHFLVVRLGGLHTALKFLEVIGKHMKSSGLEEVWIESNLLGVKTAEKVLAGNSYAKGIRAHKITIQAMWHILIPQLLDFMTDRNPELKKNLHEKAYNSATEDLISTLTSGEFEAVIEDNIASCNNPNVTFWWSYMQMVHILLLYTRAQRDGIWDLHLHAFQSMLPHFMRYNQTNYARWGTIYLNEMHQLPTEVKTEFEAGNWVVKSIQPSRS